MTTIIDFIRRKAKEKVCVEVSARGGRGGGGGRSGGSRGGRSSSSRSSSRSGRSSRSSSGKRGGIGKYAAAFAAGYTVSEFTNYRARYYGTPDYDSDPPICYTEQSGTFDNGTRTLSLGYFVCPYEETDEISDTFCCGSEHDQKCCGFWDDGGRTAGAVIGIIIGMAFLYVIVLIIIPCCNK